MEIRDRLIVALDRPDMESALELVRSISPYVGAFKVGMELYTAAGPAAIRTLVDAGCRVFYDAKFHDIPNTVAGACRAAVRHGAWMLNIHASGGPEMLTAAASAVREESVRWGISRTILIGVTLLTSLDAENLEQMFGKGLEPAQLAIRLARLSRDCGLDGVVSSAKESEAIREACGPSFIIVTPGTRRAGSQMNDQKRSTTPIQALVNGADYLVIGRDVTAALEPAASAAELLRELQEWSEKPALGRGAR